jgi:glycosyltransferase involved in cell wall biosynthesis
VQSTEEKERLLNLIMNTNVDVAPHPVYDMFADQRLSQEKAREQLGLPLGVPVLLFFGIVREYKGLKDLIRALPEVQTKLGKVMLVVAGEIWDDKVSYLDIIEDLGISDSVIIEDRYIPNEEVPVYFSAADVFVAPYLQVTGSGAVQMALGCGCPVVTTSVGNLAAVVQNGDAGLVTQSGNPQALADDIARCYLEELGQAGDRKPSNRKTPEWKQLVMLIETTT